MQYIADAKSARMLAIYTRLAAGEVLSKTELAACYSVTVRSIQRDMESLRHFLAEQGLAQEIVRDPDSGGYKLTDARPKGFTNSEILAVCKILLESRSMRKDEMLPILDKLIACCVPIESRREVISLVSNEKFHYIEPHHGKPVLDGLWEIGQAVQAHRVIEIEYEKLKHSETVRRTVEPVGLLFSEYYFYLAAFIRGINKDAAFQNPEDRYPTIYRIDRIRSFQVTEEVFKTPYSTRFEEGEFRKRVQFMYGGKLQTIKFRYTGLSIEAVLDRLPTAQILSEDETGWTIQAEVFGSGIEMWLRSQGDYIEKL